MALTQIILYYIQNDQWIIWHFKILSYAQVKGSVLLETLSVHLKKEHNDISRTSLNFFMNVFELTSIYTAAISSFDYPKPGSSDGFVF